MPNCQSCPLLARIRKIEEKVFPYDPNAEEFRKAIEAGMNSRDWSLYYKWKAAGGKFPEAETVTKGGKASGLSLFDGTEAAAVKETLYRGPGNRPGPHS